MTLIGGRDGERVERPRRRSWSTAEKQRIIEESLQPGASVSIVARRHDINANQLFTWRRLARSGELISCGASPGFVPALMTAVAPGSVQPAAEELADANSGELDSGPYITAGLLISRNPETGRQNVTIHRLQVSGPDRLGVLLLPRHTLHYYEMAERAGRALDIAIVIGVDPLTVLASQAIAPLDQDELEIAGALHGAPLEVVKCLSSELRVPAAAEIIIEGRLLPGVREPEGPFGEFPQYYGERSEKHVIAVEVVTQRKDAIFHTIHGGGLEHLTLGRIPREATLLAHLRRSFPNVLDVHLSRGGVCRYHLWVKLRKRQEGEAKNVILGAFGGHYDLKQVIVVDEDVDIHDPAEVEWAVATRFQPDRDLVVVPRAQGSKLDPSADDGVSGKMGLDATVPLGADPFRYQRIRVPGEDAVDLAMALQPAATEWRKAIAGS